MSQENLDPQDWKAMRKLAHQMVDDALDYVEHIGEKPAWQPVPPEIAAQFKKSAPWEPSSPESVYQEVQEKILPYPMGTPHPRFWGWYMGNGTIMGALGDFLSSIMNSNLGGGHHAAPMVERQVINWLKEIIQFPAEASGILVSGGSMANFIGLAVARNTNAGFDVRHEGLSGNTPQLTAYASNQIHSCNQKAIEILGLGTAALRKVPINADYTINLTALQEMIDADRQAGYRPFCVIGTSGTVNTGAIDDLNGIAAICAQEKLWFHVDGAIGAVAVLADNAKEQLSGIEKADSIALDLHKWLHIPFEAGCVLVRNGKAHRDSFSLIPEYLSRNEKGGVAGNDEWFSDYGLQLSRQFRALKVWMSAKEHGFHRFGRMIARNIDQAQYLGKLIAADPQLELIAPISLDIVCYRFNPTGLSDEQLNDLNQTILVQLHERGIAVPSYTTLNGRYCIRVAISNHRSQLSDFDALAEATVTLGQELMQI